MMSDLEGHRGCIRPQSDRPNQLHAFKFAFYSKGFLATVFFHLTFYPVHYSW